MLKPFTPNGGNFKLSRPKLPARSDLTEPDRYAKTVIDTLDQELSKTIWPLPTASGGATPVAASGGATPITASKSSPSLKDLLDQDLDSLVKDIKQGVYNPTPPNSLEKVLARDGKISLLYQVRERLNLRDYGYNTRVLLQREALFHYLFAVAVYHYSLTDPAAIASYIVDEDEEGGSRRLYEYIVIEAVRSYVKQEKIEVDDASTFIKAVGPEVKKAAYSFEKGVFEARIDRQVRSYAFNRGTSKLIEDAAGKLKLQLSPSELSYLINYFDSSEVKLNSSNKDYLVAIALTQYRNASLNTLDTTPSGTLDFSVSYHRESIDSLTINRDNVLCAAQLLYVSTLLDEAGVSTAVDLLITKYLSSGLIDIHSPRVLQDLQDYALNGEFPDLTTGRMYKRTNAEERHMFYRQVFDYGDSTLLDGMSSNQDFEPLWNALMVETVRYIEKLEQSERPESFVSRQSVAQAIEDLQYNLSTYTSGMVKLLTPVMYKELNFIIERIFKSPEVIAQLALHNSKSFGKVIERIIKEHSGQSISFTAFQNKAEYGHQILKSVAEYTVTMIDDDAEFSNFVSLVQAFIIASEQLEKRPPTPFEQPVLAPDDSGVSSDDWAF